ncbi:Hint domain-containing protein [Thioclava sp. GXIMD2076]|uniref:Hint domain-containing protein n=1 Tax=Thioclava sp. GXIMD2076 TaxID=3131931 RepID=UPI0030CBAB8F
MIGGYGNDLFSFASGWGQDTILGDQGDSTEDGGKDMLDFSGMASGVSVTFTGSEDGTAASGSDSLTFDNIEAVQGGSGDDTFNAAADSSGLTLSGGGGADSITGGSGADTLAGGMGNDTLYGGTGADSIAGDDGNDYIDGGSEDDIIWGGTGDDTILGGTGNDIVAGEAGNDSIDGGAGADTVRGGTGDDLIWGGDDNDALYGDDGNDIIAGEAGNDLVDGGAGNDLISGGTGTDTLKGGTGSDTFSFYGGDGIDVVQGGEDPDNSDTDALDFSNADQGFKVTFSGAEAGSFASATTDSTGSFTEIERIVGSNYADSIDASADTSGIELHGGSGADTLIGGSGADHLDGGTGNDSLASGAGNDTLSGGAGADTYALSDGGGADTVADFDITLVGSTTTDQLDVSGLTGADGNPVNAWDVTVSDVGGNALLTFPDGTSILLNGVAPASVTTAPQLHSIGIPCFVAGTMIDTPSGPRAVETIRTGDEVLTAEGQPITVIWAGGKTFDAADLATCERLKPIVFRPSSIGNARELRLSRQHRVVVDTIEGPRLVAAGGLAAARGFGARIAKGCRKVSYRHLLLT